jgi:hypothetical protein
MTKFPSGCREKNKKGQDAVYCSVTGGAAGLWDPAVPPVMKENRSESLRAEPEAEGSFKIPQKETGGETKQTWKKSKAT